MVNFISWILSWLIVGWLLGVLGLFAGGFMLALPLGSRGRNRVANIYSRLAMRFIGRSALFERGTKYDLKSGTHDSEKNADKYSLGDSDAHVTNETGLQSTFHKQPFGLVASPEEDIAVYVSPEIAELGEIEANRQEQGSLTSDSGNYLEEVTLAPRRPLVKLRGFARRMIPGSRSIYDLDETVDLYQQSQRMFGESKTTQFMILIIAYGGASLLTWLILTNAGGAVPDTSISVPGLGMLMPGVP